MTFVYRQLLGVSEAFDPIVLAHAAANLDRFPFPRVLCHPLRPWHRVWRATAAPLLGRPAWAPASMLRAFAGWVREYDVRLLHAHFGNSALEILPVAREAGIPLLVTFHGMDASQYLRRPAYVRGVRELFEHAHVICVSRRIAERMIGLGARPDRVEVHHIGTDVADFAYVERTPLREKVAARERVELLQVANFVEKKGHEHTLRAFRGLVAARPACRLTFAGDGPLRRRMEQLAGTLGLRERVRFLGPVPVPQVMELMREADVFVHHSVTSASGDEEGIPTVLMEAMSTGLVVVSTNHAGIPELVTHGETGLLVDERDGTAYLRALERALDDDGTLGRQAAQSVREGFDVARQNAALVEIYRRQIEGSGR